MAGLPDVRRWFRDPLLIALIVLIIVALIPIPFLTYRVLNPSACLLYTSPSPRDS